MYHGTGKVWVIEWIGCGGKGVDDRMGKVRMTEIGKAGC